MSQSMSKWIEIILRLGTFSKGNLRRCGQELRNLHKSLKMILRASYTVFTPYVPSRFMARIWETTCVPISKDFWEKVKRRDWPLFSMDYQVWQTKEISKIHKSSWAKSFSNWRMTNFNHSQNMGSLSIRKLILCGQHAPWKSSLNLHWSKTSI